MAGHYYCHGPSCHEKVTTDRVRGPKGNKVLRTRKINQSSDYIRNSVWSVFCSQGCYTDFFYKHWAEVIKIAPRDKPLETPIEDPKKVRPYENAQWYNWEIKEVDNNSNP